MSSQLFLLRRQGHHTSCCKGLLKKREEIRMRVSEEEEVWLTRVKKGLIQCETMGVITTRAKKFRKIRF